MECFPKGQKGTVGRVQCLQAHQGAAQVPPALQGHREACQHHELGENASPQGCGARPCAQLLRRASLRGLGGWLACTPPHQIISPSSSSIPELCTPKSWIQLRLQMLQSPLSSSAWGTNLGHFLWLLGSCRDILTLSLIPDHPLTRSHKWPRLWTHSPWGVLRTISVESLLSLGCDVLVFGELGEALLPVPAPPAWTLLTY